MFIKSFEVRDRMTTIAVIAVKMTASSSGDFEPEEFGKRLWLLNRCGYDQSDPAVILLRMDGTSRMAPSDPYDWGDRTMRTAHVYITEHFSSLADGDVVDVEYILGETSKPKRSEQED